MARNLTILKNQEGFTLVELLVVVGIIALISALATINWQTSQNSLALQRSAVKVSQDIKRAAELSLRGQSPPSGCQLTGSGYGIYFDAALPNSYLIFADCNANQTYNAGTDAVIATLNLESNVIVSSVSPNPLSMVFIPPDPVVWANGSQVASLAVFTVTLALQNNPSTTKLVTINSKGVVSIQ